MITPRDASAVSDLPELKPPTAARRMLERLQDAREFHQRKHRQQTDRLAQIESYLGLAEPVSQALDKLSEQLFDQLVGTLERSLSHALQEILEQPIVLKTRSTAKWQSQRLDFYVEQGGHEEDILKGQGGSVANVLSVMLRIFALTQLDDRRHRRFLVLAEQDGWLRPDLVPRLVKIVAEAGRELGFQVLLISHHDVDSFAQYADKIYELVPHPEGVQAVERRTGPAVEDDDLA